MNVDETKLRRVRKTLENQITSVVSGVSSVNGDTGAVTLDYSDVGAAPSSKGVTNGDTHDHSGGDGAQINHTTLSNIGTNTHAQIDTHLGSTSNPHSVTKAQVGLTNVTDTAQIPSSYLDTDGTLSANSDSRVATQKAVKTYADTKLTTPVAWTHFTPTLTGWTLGNGTRDGAYTQMGKTIHGWIKFVFGSSGSAVGALTLTLPISRDTAYGAVSPIGEVALYDIDGGVYSGVLWANGAIKVRQAAGTYLRSDYDTSSSVPFTWANGDVLEVQFTYEAA